LSQLITKTDPNGNVNPHPPDFQWVFTYDGTGNLTKVIEPEPAGQPEANRYTTSYVWNANGTLASITDADTHPATTFDSYDANGLPTQVTDGAGQVTKFGYDSDGQLLWIQDPLHATDTGSKPREYRTYFDFDSFHRLGRQSTSKSTRFDRGRLVWSSTDYDPNDNVTSIMAPHFGVDDGKNGSKTAIAYDLMDRRTLVTGPDKSFDPAGERTKYDYDDAGRVARVTLPQGMFLGQSQAYVIDSAYDLLDRVIKQTRFHKNPDNSITSLNTHFCFDTNGDLVRVTAPKAGLDSVDCSLPQPPAFTRTYTYFFDHKLKSQADPLGHTKSFTYDANRNLTTTTDENGQPENRSYDQRNLLTQIEQQFTHAPDPNRKVTTKFEYDGVGNRTKLWSPRASDANNGDYVTTYAYDTANRLSRVTLPRATGFTQYYVEHSYDADGNLTCTSLPVATDVACGSLSGSSKTVMDYWDPGWIERTDDPGNAVPPAIFDYRAEGWQTSRIPEGDPSFEVDWAYYDDGTLKQVSEQKNGNPSTYSYDADNNLIQAKAQSVDDDKLVVTVQGTYDWLDRITKARAKKSTDANWKATLFTYDLNSNVATREDNRVENEGGGQVNPGRIYSFTYDQADWLTAQTDDRGTAGDCTDDAKITNSFFPTGWEQTRKFFRADSLCAFQQKQQTDWTYFDNGKVKSVDTQAKQNGQMVSVEHHDVTYIETGITPNQYVDGNRVKDTFTLKGPNMACNLSTCSSTYAYDPRDKLIKEVKVRDTTTTVEYGLDPDGNILSITTNGSPTKSFTYTGDQLATVTAGGVTQKYFYDPRGNLDCITTDQGSPQDCPQTKGKAVPASLLVDYTYDFMNRLTDFAKYANSNKTDSATYTNDALSRVDTEKETHPGVPDRTTVFTYLGLTNRVTKEVRTDSGGDTTKVYSYDAYGHRVEMTNTPPPGQGQAKDYTYAFDVHGDVSLLLDESNGTAKESYGYDPYGDKDSQLTQGQGSNDDKNPFNPYRYASGRIDSGSQTYDMGARRFGPDVAHFLQTDLFQGALDNLELTMDPLTGNRYALGGGNPIDFVEWDGHIVRRDDYAGASNSGNPLDPSAPAQYGLAQPSTYFFTFEPRPGYGTVYGGLYIESRFAQVLFSRLRGDNRGPSAHASITRYRTYFSLNFETGEGVIWANPTCFMNGNCTSARPFDNSLRGLLRTDVNRVFVSSTRDSITLDFQVKESKHRLSPRIDASITLVLGGGGRFSKPFIDRENYPALEIYQRTGNETRTIVQQDEGTPYDLGSTPYWPLPLLSPAPGPFPLAPNPGEERPPPRSCAWWAIWCHPIIG